MKFAEFIREDRLLEILLFLNASAGFGGSNYLLREALDYRGHTISMDLLIADLHWLDEHDLLDLAVRDDGVVAKLTQKGQDVCLGRTTHPGVKRPKPA